MQLNYSYLKILKLKIHSLFLVTLFCAHVTWWQHFTTLTIGVFSIPFFLNANPQVLLLISGKSSLNWPKIRNGLLLQNNQIVKRGNFVTGIKIFTRNNLTNFHCVYLTLTDSKFAIIPSGFDKFEIFCKCFKFCYCDLLVPTNVIFDSTEYVFRGSELLKLVIFLPSGNYGVGKEKLPFQKTVSSKISGYGPVY